MEKIITEIAELLDIGECVYLHKQTHEILAHPDPTNHNFDPEYEYLIDETMEQMGADIENYIEFNPPNSTASFRLMEDFAFALPNERFQLQLLDALKSKKPFRYFRNAVDDSPFREDWFDFKQKRLEEMVKSTLEMALNE